MQLFDAHLHIIDPRFALVANNGFLPSPFTVQQYLAAMQGWQLTGGAVVAGSFQGEDPSWLLAALQALGPSFVGVCQLPLDTPDDTVLALHRAGVRAVRINLFRGGNVPMKTVQDLALRVHDIAGWHVELYADSATLAHHVDSLARLPRVSIDHLGLSEAGLPTLLRLVGKGIHVKASGFGRLDFDVAGAIQAIHRENPLALMFGSDLPGTRAPRPFCRQDVALLEQVLGTDSRAVLHDNARAFYRLAAMPARKE